MTKLNKTARREARTAFSAALHAVVGNMRKHVSAEDSGEWEERWTGDYIFENEWQSFRTKKDRRLELTSVFHECPPGRRKLAVKVVDIFGNDTMTIVEVRV